MSFNKKPRIMPMRLHKRKKINRNINSPLFPAVLRLNGYKAGLFMLYLL